MTWEAADPQRPEGRRLREEAGLAHGGGHRQYGRTTGAKIWRDWKGNCDATPAQFPFVRGSGKRWEIAQNAKPGPNAIRADLLHEAGAQAVQELGYALAAGVERLAKLSAEKPVDLAAGEIDFVFAVGPTYFFEIAKLRAARLLWAQAVTAFGPADEDSCRMRLAVRTSQRNKSALRSIHQPAARHHRSAFGGIGGCDQLTVEPFAFDPHLALNVQRILKEESHLDAVADPAGGSYYIEALTDSLAREGLEAIPACRSRRRLFGGAGFRIDRRRRLRKAAPREKRQSVRARRTLVGVNNYPNVAEKTPEFAAPKRWRPHLAANPDGRAVRADPRPDGTARARHGPVS